MSTAKSLTPDALYQRCDPAEFGFETTEEIEGLNQMLGQERAVEAIELGAELDIDGYNLFVLGSPGTGRHSFIRQFLQKLAAEKSAPSDWCYVNNFDDPRRPIALEFPAGKGSKFRDDIGQLIEEGRSAIPAAFESEDYHKRKQAIKQEAEEKQRKAFEEVQEHARERGLGIIQTATGFTFVPLSNGETLSAEEYQNLSEKEQERLAHETEKMGEELRQMLRKIPRVVRKVREKIRELDREVALFAVGSLIDELFQEYRDQPKVTHYLEALQQDIADNVELFTQPEEEEGKPLVQLFAGRHASEQMQGSPLIRRYGVNLLIDCADVEGAPVVYEDHPTYPYLIGQVEHIAKMGALMTDYHLLRAGALHRANGGYLVLDIRKILVQPFAWEGLKRALKSAQVDIKSMAQAYSLVSTVSLEPEPIPLKLKVILIGDRLFYYLLQAYDPEFLELFKVAADFEDEMDRSEHNVQQMAQLVGTLAKRENLRPVDRGGVARVIEESSRLAGDAEMLSAQIRRLADIVREAHYWANRNQKEVIGEAEIQLAIDGQLRRQGRLRDKLQREILRDTILIDTEGERIGQINGLAVLQLGDILFGRPSRITARVSLGSGKVIDIEREVKLGGSIHSKGVLILSSFLASHYVPEHPLSFSASLVFEQSYGPVEGDSASAAELCALLSALAQIPLRQSLAITGSVNQYGRIQAIGGVNQKIEGFFDICRERGLTDDQGVIIPVSNAKHLMLRQDVIRAVEKGEFHIYTVETIDQCMETLTGLAAGERDAEGNFPVDSINRNIADRLVELAEKRREFVARAKPDEAGGTEAGGD